MSNTQPLLTLTRTHKETQLRLYDAICAYLEARADYFRRPDPEPPEPQPEGATAQVEPTGQYEREELNQDAYHRNDDWSEDPDQAQHPQYPMGFTRLSEDTYRVNHIRRSAITNRYITTKEDQ